MKVLVDGQTFSTPDINRGIGTYLLNILQKIGKINPFMEIVLAVYDDYDRSCMQYINANVKIVSLGEKLTVNEVSHKIYADRIEKIIKEEQIDLFWIPNYLMLNVNFIDHKLPCHVVITVYDLIPLVFKSEYMDIWPAEISKNYNKRLSSIDLISNMIISISEATKRDLIHRLGIDCQKVVTIYLGYKKSVGVVYGKDYLLKKFGTCNYILYVGGFDYRKNMERSVLAYKRLIETYPCDNLSFVIACSYDQHSKDVFTKLLKDNGLEHKVILTGFVADNELASLYSNARAFFFPSLYEGFGLPLIDAMSNRAPIAAAKDSSIPEVVGDAGLLFDPGNIDDMADKLHKIVSNGDYSEELKLKGIDRVKRFSWDNAASELIDEFYRLYGRIEKNGPHPRIAYFSPVSPQKSGISDYTEELLPYLSKYADIDLFLDEKIMPSDPFILAHVPYYSYNKFEEKLSNKKYDAVIYNMGNNTIHRYIYETLQKHPGITILHDYVLHPFIQYITVLSGDSKAYRAEMTYAYGNEGKKLADDYINRRDCYIDNLKYPLNERIVERSKLVFVHSHYVIKLLAGHDKIKLIPQGIRLNDRDLDSISAIKKELGMDKARIIISCFGFMNQNKRINVLLDAFKRLQKIAPNSMLILVGEINDNYKRSISKFIDENNLSDRIKIVGRCSDELYYKYLSCTDIVVNLRHPTMGETSRTLLEAMAYCKPTLVTNAGSYKEFPDNCCWKVDADICENELLFAYLKALIDDDRLREKMSNNAMEYVKKYHNWDSIAIEIIRALRFVNN